MAASSVTGVGPGDSNGKQKPNLHSGCGCSGPVSPRPPVVVRKNGCYARYSSCSVARTSFVLGHQNPVLHLGSLQTIFSPYDESWTFGSHKSGRK
jgi:hypothetical protein